MECPACRNRKTVVLDSRKAKRHKNVIKRRRKCMQCSLRFTTYEHLMMEINTALGFISRVRRLSEGFSDAVREEVKKSFPE